MNPKTYTYKLSNIYQIAGSINFILAIICIMVGVVILLAGILAFAENHILSRLGNSILYFIGFSIWSPSVFIGLTFLYTDVTVDDTGINLPFVFRIIHINWGDITDVKNANSLLGFPLMKKASIIISKTGLTPFHRIYGLMYGKTSQPSFLIFSSIQGYNELMQTIIFHKKNNHKES